MAKIKETSATEGKGLAKHEQVHANKADGETPCNDDFVSGFPDATPLYG